MTQPPTHTRLVPLAPADNEVLGVRDAVRDLLAFLGLEEVQVNVEHIGRRSTIVLAPLPLETAGKLIGVLGSHPASQSEGLRIGTVMWDPNHRLVGEVVAGGNKRVKLRALANDSTWYAHPSELRPPRLVDIDAARAARQEVERRARER
jgi:hypothetical protein